MSAIGNFIWFILGGFLLGICWWIFGLLAFITIVGIPWGKACFVMGEFSFFPFGKEAIDRKDLSQKDDIGTGGYALLGNIIWFLFAGMWLALVHALSAIIGIVTIIGIPFAVQHLKLASLALLPIGKTIVNKDTAAVARKQNAENALSVIRQQNNTLSPNQSTESDTLPKESKSIGDSLILVAFLAGLVLMSVLYAFKPNEQITEAAPAYSAEAAPADATPAIETLTYDASILPNGELEEIFSFGSDHTDLQRELKLKEIKGKVIVWSLPVYDIQSTDNGYKIQTDSHYKDDLLGEKLVGTFINITARNDEEKRLIESLKKGDLIHIKGDRSNFCVTEFCSRFN